MYKNVFLHRGRPYNFENTLIMKICGDKHQSLLKTVTTTLKSLNQKQMIYCISRVQFSDKFINNIFFLKCYKQNKI